jgi:predicted dehydrogenase
MGAWVLINGTWYKPVYSEKPLAGSLAQADALIALAEQKGLLLACAPATFLWPPLATAKRLIDKGRLGPITGALSTLVYPGPELFHPSPAHLYDIAAGPLRDMGVYQITALMALLGPVTSVGAMASKATNERVVRVGPDAGQRFPVHSQTHIHAQLLHQSGAISTVIVSFDASSATEPRIELFGRDGGLCIRNAHRHDAELTLLVGDAAENVPLDGPAWSPALWAIGPTSAWSAHASNRPVAASAYRARDVLEVLLAIEAAAKGSQVIALTAR